MRSGAICWKAVLSTYSPIIRWSFCPTIRIMAANGDLKIQETKLPGIFQKLMESQLK